MAKWFFTASALNCLVVSQSEWQNHWIRSVLPRVDRALRQNYTVILKILALSLKIESVKHHRRNASTNPFDCVGKKGCHSQRIVHKGHVFGPLSALFGLIFTPAIACEMYLGGNRGYSTVEGGRRDSSNSKCLKIKHYYRRAYSQFA